MRTVRVQPGYPVGPDRELHARPPAQARARQLIAGKGLDRDLPVESRQPPQLLADHGGLERSLGWQRGRGVLIPLASLRAGQTGPVPDLKPCPERRRQPRQPVLDRSS